MNSERNKYRRRSLLGSIVLSLLIIGVPVLGSVPAQSETVDSSLSIPVSASFTASNGTSFRVSGDLVINCSAVLNDPDVPPFVILTFDASSLTVTSGSGSSRKTYDTRGFQVVKIRPLKATDVITVAVPNIQTSSPLTQADRYEATFTLNFSTTGRITSGTVTARPATVAQ